MVKRPKTIADMIASEALAGKHVPRGLSGRSMVIVNWPEIAEGLRHGLSVKAIWNALSAHNRVRVPYKTFLRHVQSYMLQLKRVESAELVNAAMPVDQPIMARTTMPTAAPVSTTIVKTAADADRLIITRTFGGKDAGTQRPATLPGPLRREDYFNAKGEMIDPTDGRPYGRSWVWDNELQKPRPMTIQETREERKARYRADPESFAPGKGSGFREPHFAPYRTREEILGLDKK
jgi:hypothetical protein